MKINLQFFGGRGSSGSRASRATISGGGGTASAAATTTAASITANAIPTLDQVRRQFVGQTAADVQAEIGRIFRELGSPMNGNPARETFNARTAPLRQLISETINNGTGFAGADYNTLLRTSRVTRRS